MKDLSTDRRLGGLTGDSWWGSWGRLCEAGPRGKPRRIGWPIATLSPSTAWQRQCLHRDGCSLLRDPLLWLHCFEFSEGSACLCGFTTPARSWMISTLRGSPKLKMRAWLMHRHTHAPNATLCALLLDIPDWSVAWRKILLPLGADGFGCTSHRWIRAKVADVDNTFAKFQSKATISNTSGKVTN